MLIRQLELERRQEHREDHLCRFLVSSVLVKFGHKRDELISSWENLKPLPTSYQRPRLLELREDKHSHASTTTGPERHPMSVISTA